MILVVFFILSLGTCQGKRKELEVEEKNGLTCAGPFCLPEDYDKLTLPFDSRYLFGIF